MATHHTLTEQQQCKVDPFMSLKSQQSLPAISSKRGSSDKAQATSCFRQSKSDKRGNDRTAHGTETTSSLLQSTPESRANNPASFNHLTSSTVVVRLQRDMASGVASLAGLPLATDVLPHCFPAWQSVEATQHSATCTCICSPDAGYAARMLQVFQ